MLCFQQAKAQQDTLRDIVKKVFYHKKVCHKVFSDYQGLGGPPHALPDGRYAFIFPDTTFQKIYPDILERLSLSWGTERKLFTITYIMEPDGIVFIKNDTEKNQKKSILFDLISISKKEAYIIFHTYWVWELRGENRPKEKFKCSLVNKKGQWKIKKIVISPFYYEYPE